MIILIWLLCSAVMHQNTVGQPPNKAEEEIVVLVVGVLLMRWTLHVEEGVSGCFSPCH